MENQSCPCESGHNYADCCAAVISGQKKASSPVVLMRARYTAYTQVNMDFIESSHDPKTRSDWDRNASEDWAKRTKWLGLEIIETKNGGPEDQTGQVEFRAKFSGESGEEHHHEVSHFKKRQGQWYFSDAKFPSVKTIVHDEPKVGRNDPCSCGSGKKYKKCCGKAA